MSSIGVESREWGCNLPPSSKPLRPVGEKDKEPCHLKRADDPNMDYKLVVQRGYDLYAAAYLTLVEEGALFGSRQLNMGNSGIMVATTKVRNIPLRGEPITTY